MSKKILARVLETSDKHLRNSDFKTIGNYSEAVVACIRDQIKYCKDNGITHVVDYGDICDKGYGKLSTAYSHENLFKEWTSILKQNHKALVSETGYEMTLTEESNYYSTLGNHLWHEIENNPEFHWIQPNPYVKPMDRDYILPEYALLNVTDKLIIGSFMYSFHHFNRTDKNYYIERPAGITHHRGIYHDDTMIPKGIQTEYNIHRNISSEYIRGLFANVDSAAVGHIHKPYDLQTVYIDGRAVPMDIPGSCCLTSVKHMELHRSVKLPVYTIYDDDSFMKEYVEFSLHIDKLKFYDKKIDAVPKELMDIAQGLSGYTDGFESENVYLATLGSYMTAEEYLRAAGLTNLHIEIYNAARTGDLNLEVLMQIILKKKENSNESIQDDLF